MQRLCKKGVSMLSAVKIPSEKRGLLLGCLLALSFLLYANSILNGFVFDDHSQIERNPYVHSFKYTGKLFGSSLLAQQGKQAAPNFYRPTVNFGFLICYKLFGSSPYGFHLVNIFLNCIVVWLVFRVGSELFANEWLGFLGAIIFALHPIHTEPVAWIDGISDPEVTLFCLLTLLLFVRLTSPEAPHTTWTFPAMLGTFALALLAKEPAMTFPVLATVYEHFYRADRHCTRWTQKVARYGGFWILLCIYLGVRALSVGRLAPADLHSDISAREMVFSALALIGQYAKKLVWPSPLVAFYPFQKSERLLEPQVLLGLGVLLIFVLAFLLLRKHVRPYTFALLWMCLTIAPALNVRWMAATVFAERYLYLPSVGFSWLVAGALVWLRSRTEKRIPVLRWVTAAAGIGLFALCTYGIVKRNREWKSDRDLVVSSLVALPESPHMHVEYGMFNWNAGDREAAEHEWQLALHYKPDSVEALADLGFARLEEKKYEDAIPFLQKAIDLKPRFATPHIHLGRVYAAEGRNDLAEAELRRALDIHPTNTNALNALGEFYLQQGRASEASEQFRSSVEVYSDLQPWSNLGEIYDHENERDKAQEAWEHVLTFESFNAHAHRSLGQIYLSKGQWTSAQNEFQKCLLMDPKDSVALAALRKISNISGYATKE
jgi:tetratricopeptide (TPR) repeat protein